MAYPQNLQRLIVGLICYLDKLFLVCFTGPNMGAIEDAEKHARIAYDRYGSSHPDYSLPVLGFLGYLQEVAQEMRVHSRAKEPIEPLINLPRFLKFDEIGRLTKGIFSARDQQPSQVILGGVSFVAAYGLVSLIIDLNRAIRNSH